MLVACAADKGRAPVDDRSIRNRSQGSATWYTVRRGDTLFSISFDNGRDYRDVAEINRIGPPYIIYPGQRLRLVPENTATRPSKGNKTGSSNPRSASKKQVSVGNKKTVTYSKVSWSWPTRGSIVRAYSASAPRKKGIGIGGKAGQVISAAASGKVVYSGDGLLGYGNLIIIKHNDEYLSAYAHNEKVYVKEGQAVKRGEKIATMGENENNTPMLHFEIRKNGKPVNPGDYLPRG